MSRKKKKKQKRLVETEQLPGQEALNGWSCSSDDLTADDEYEYYDTDEDADGDGQSDAPQSELPRFEPQPEAWVQPSFEASATLRSESALRSESEPQTQTENEPQPESEPRSEPPKPDVGDLAEDIKERVTDRLAQSKDGLLKLFTQPHKSAAELEEDMEKFGGLDDEPEQGAPGKHAVRAKAAELLQKLKSLRRTKFAPPKPGDSPEQTGSAPTRAAEPTAIATQPKQPGPLYPVVRYASETCEWGYTECYYIGIQVLRNLSDLRRRVFGMWMWARYSIPHFIRKKRHQIARVFDAITDSCLHPFRDITKKTVTMRVGISKIIDRRQEHRFVESTKVFFRYLYSLGNPINKIASFVLPILGCAVLATVVLYFQNINYALSVEYSGVQLGYIAREGDFYEAKNKVYDRLINEEYVPPDDSRPIFRLVIADPDNLISTEALANKLMSISKNEVAMADGIYIDGAFLGAVEDGSEFLFYIDSILDNYRTETVHERVQFVKKVGLQRGMYPVSSIRPVHEIKNALENNDVLPQTHKVLKDETLETIAEENNTTVDDIMKLNTSLLVRAEEANMGTPAIREGEEILVNRVELSLGIQVIRREEYTEEIPYGTDYTEDNKELEAYVEVLSHGKKGERQIISDITYIDGERVDETVLERNVIAEPVNERKVRGTLKPADFLPAGGGDANASFIWPVAGGYVSAGLYGYAGHSGMDIAAPYGTGIYAGRSGTVTYASNRNIWPYGRRVNISHGGGVTSLYAHCSEVVVQTGQYVKQGQLIAKVGRTGNATGNHCHLEIRVNGRIMNPASFIGKG